MKAYEMKKQTRRVWKNLMRKGLVNDANGGWRPALTSWLTVSQISMYQAGARAPKGAL